MIGNWWGFRIRLPQGYVASPLTKAELLAFFGNISAWLQCAWLTWLVLGPAPHPDRVFRHEVMTPVLIASAAIAMALLIPASLMERTWAAARFVYARESGQIRRIDHIILVLTVVAGGVALWKRPLHWPAIVTLLGTVIAVEIVLAFVQERLVFDTRHEPLPVPGWLSQIDVTEDGGIVQGEPGAQKQYPFRVGEVLHHIGVAIGEELLASLREINARFQGRLFHDQALAVILADRDPVLRIGKDEVLRLAAQVFAIGKQTTMTRFALANAVLTFVQEQIRYAFDEESTTSFAGGPFPEYGRFALETMNDGVGDCDCTAILTATLLSHIGFDTALIFLSFHDPETNEICHHAAVGLSTADLFVAAEQAFDAFTFEGRGNDRRRYLYGETAVEGTTLAFGSVPAEWKSTLDIYKIVAIPRWTTA